MKQVIIAIVLSMTLSPLLFAGGSRLIEGDNTYFFASGNPLMLAQSDDLNEDLYALEEGGQAGRKSAAKAVLLSLALPGLGELYAGRTARAAGFFTAEVGIWASFIYFKHRQNWLEDDYINLAIQYAGIDPQGKSDFFYDMVGFYDNRDQYNKVSRVYTRSNPFFPETPQWDWQWSSDERQRQYREVKNSSKAQGRNANFSLGLALANRVISAIDAWWSVKSHNRNLSPLLSKVHLRLSPSLGELIGGQGSPGFMISYRHNF